MFLFPLILAAELNMTLPEFQPEKDLSGNYVYSEIDLSSNEIVVESKELPDGLTVEAPLEKSSGDRSTYTMIFPVLTNTRVLNNVLYNEYNYNTNYYLLEPGYIYSFTSGNQPWYTCSSLDYGTSCSYLGNTISDFIVQSPIYIVCTQSGVSGSYVVDPDYVDPDQPSGDISGSDMTAVVEGLSILNDNVVSGNDQIIERLDSLEASQEEFFSEVDIKLRSILFVLIWIFVIKIALKVRDNVFLKHNG